MNNHFVLDVESDGPCPDLYNMISFALVNVEDRSKYFHGEVYPHVMNNGGIKEARDVSGISWEQQLEFDDCGDVMYDALNWIKGFELTSKPIMWSDNPAFDWQWWNYYCHVYIGENPFGHSARRIGDLYAGYMNDRTAHSKWKKHRKVKHDHNPVNDAVGNVNGLNFILNKMSDARFNIQG